MTVISSKEFAANQTRYYNLAQNEQLGIKRGKNMYHLKYINGHNANEYDEISDPDEDLNRAISADEFNNRCLKFIDKIFDKCQ